MKQTIRNYNLLVCMLLEQLISWM